MTQIVYKRRKLLITDANKTSSSN